MHYRNALRVSLLLLTIHWVLPAAAVELDDALIGAVLGTDLDEPDLWGFQVDLIGTADITSATLTVPDQGETLIVLNCDTCNEGVVSCDFDSSDSGPGFASLQALLDSYPAGTYGLSINGGARTAALGFDPMDPQADVTITAPTNGASNVSPTPSVEYTTGCSELTHCDLLGFGLFSAGGGGGFPSENVDLVYTTTEIPGSGSVPYASFEAASASDACSSSAKPPALPDGLYIVVGLLNAGTISTESFDQGSGIAFEFRYRALTARTSPPALFTVPEAGGTLSALAALGALATLRVRSARWRSVRQLQNTLQRS